MKRNEMKIIELLKNNTAYTLIVVAMGWAFLIGVFTEKVFSREAIFKMQNECVKRRVADFHLAENGEMEFRWKKY